ncbi:Major facilitator superfamily transporter [Cordyceps javanica]|uniref:Major facilitator superfamily transporter n=1 Tax=Cordyceps javanica TaxID=43265 RepID=A0A545VIH4_9HYPO|nr:Major facilitator superfamily transporter [Cordyceps javanica]TQW01533.1 Major facilitator superfamily transporter [Cordyceps javanica]
MASPTTEQRLQDQQHPPGTLLLEDLQHGSGNVLLHPIPTADPNDPLNWSTPRKAFSIGLVLLYVMLTFVQLDIGVIAFAQYQNELGFNINTLNSGQAMGYAGLGLSSILFVPLMNKYGRRPIYVISLVLQVAACVWLAMTKTTVDLLLSNLLAGFGGGICETIVQMTIADIFFVHQHAAMNAYYLFSTTIGSTLGPVAAGYVIESQGWRWMWWWCVILIGANLVLVLFLFEESKYTPMLNGETIISQSPLESDHEENISADRKKLSLDVGDALQRSITDKRPHIDEGIPMKTYRQRLALLSPTDEQIFNKLLDSFVILVTFPAVAFTAITFGSLLALFALVMSVQATYLFLPPYNFTAVGVGLINISGFISAIPAAFVGGWLDDRLILSLSKRNGGLYEPEMRLWLSLPCIILSPASVLMVGLGFAYGVAWPLIAVGSGLFSFCLSVSGSIALSYTMDCYHSIVGSSMIGIIFMRNVFAVVILFALTPWIMAMGLVYVHIIVAGILFMIQLLVVPFLIWGKTFRAATSQRYRRRAQGQSTNRE